MEEDDKLKLLLRELTGAISRCLSAPENLVRLERLQKSGYDLFLILEPSDEEAMRISPTPIMQMAQNQSPKPKQKKITAFQLSEEDKDFLRTLKIKVDEG